mmetsp:Transcript_43641/g.134755  ORF Transcript_43641/g.134755 Transcript_43641/m.134755 type:complete len:252 (-) Transcript_43641:12-767(-)
MRITDTYGSANSVTRVNNAPLTATVTRAVLRIPAAAKVMMMIATIAMLNARMTNHVKRTLASNTSSSTVRLYSSGGGRTVGHGRSLPRAVGSACSSRRSRSPRESPATPWTRAGARTGARTGVAGSRGPWSAKNASSRRTPRWSAGRSTSTTCGWVRTVASEHGVATMLRFDAVPWVRDLSLGYHRLAPVATEGVSARYGGCGNAVGGEGRATVAALASTSVRCQSVAIWLRFQRSGRRTMNRSCGDAFCQ